MAEENARDNLNRIDVMKVTAKLFQILQQAAREPDVTEYACGLK